MFRKVLARRGIPSLLVFAWTLSRGGSAPGHLVKIGRYGIMAMHGAAIMLLMDAKLTKMKVALG